MTAAPSLLLTAAIERPDKAAVIIAETGDVTTYAQLEERSRRVAAALAARGLARGDHVAILMENSAAYLEIAWAAQRSGLYYTPINAHLRSAEVDHIVSDSGSAVLFASASLADVATGVSSRSSLTSCVAVDGDLPGFEPYAGLLASVGADAGIDETEGAPMFYSSGTTGRPKGVQHALPPRGQPSAISLAARGSGLYSTGPDTVHLTPAPLYHAAPLVRSMTVHRSGGTVVLMRRFDPVAALRAIEEFRVSQAQFVPTMFVRLLRLDETTRNAFDVSSLEVVMHAAAPCPVDVKRAMLEWWGPVLHEYYSGTEANGRTIIGPEEWLAHPGSVGRAAGCEVHIVGDDGDELPAGVTGLVYFSGGGDFAYHNDPAKTAAARHPRGWTTLGDIGHLDADGYLYLTDRRDFVIISGGVNIYPREIEDALLTHPRVTDAAVFGVPEPEYGEQVVAVVEPDAMDGAGDALAEELRDHCRARLASYKCPRIVEFVPDMARDPSGKLRKDALREAFRARLRAGALR